MVPWWFWAVLALYGGQRLFELWLNQRNARRLAARGARLVEDDVYGAIVTLHLAYFLALGFEALAAPWSGLGWWSWAGLGLFAAGQGLRVWSMITLGERWTTRIWVLPGASPIQTGPYRYLDHPIYLGVALELVGFPLVFGLPATAVLVTLVNLPLLRARIRREETALRQAAAEPNGS